MKEQFNSDYNAEAQEKLYNVIYSLGGHLPSEADKCNILELISARADINGYDDDNDRFETPLVLATENRNPSLVQFLLQNNAKADFATFAMRSPIFFPWTAMI